MTGLMEAGAGPAGHRFKGLYGTLEIGRRCRMP
jgi:hypothetical protein